MSIFKVVSCFFFTALIVSTLSAQNDNEPPRIPFKERLVFGGNVVASINERGTALGLSPRVGYRVSERYVPGIGISYIYQSYANINVNNFAASIFNRFYPIEQGFIEAEFEYGRAKFSGSGLAAQDDVVLTYPALLLGAGIRQGGGGGGVGFSAGIFYDVLQDPNSPYGTRPIYRGGVFIGF